MIQHFPRGMLKKINYEKNKKNSPFGADTCGGGDSHNDGKHVFLVSAKRHKDRTCKCCGDACGADGGRGDGIFGDCA